VLNLPVLPPLLLPLLYCGVVLPPLCPLQETVSIAMRVPGREARRVCTVILQGGKGQVKSPGDKACGDSATAVSSERQQGRQQWRHGR